MNKELRNLRFYANHADSTIKKLSDKALDPSELLMYNLLERLRNACFSLETLLNGYQRGTQVHEFSIGIILRALMLDTLISINTSNYLQDLHATAPDDINAQWEYYCSAFLSDGFDKTIHYAEHQLSHDLITNEEARAFYNKFVELYDTYFEDYPFDGSRPRLKDYSKIKRSPTQLFHNIARSKNKVFTRVYDSYMYYCKYDHQSVNTLTFMRLGDLREEHLKNAIIHLGLHTVTCHELLLFSEIDRDFLQAQYDQIGEYCLKNL